MTPAANAGAQAAFSAPGHTHPGVSVKRGSLPPVEHGGWLIGQSGAITTGGPWTSTGTYYCNAPNGAVSYTSSDLKLNNG